MDIDEMMERHDKYMRPYRACFLVLEFVIMPVAAILAGYVLGYLSPAIGMAIAYFIADITAVIVRGRTLLGVKIGKARPRLWPRSHWLTIMIISIIMLLMAAVGLLEIIIGHLIFGLAIFCLVIANGMTLIMQWRNKYDSRMSVVSAFLLLITALLIAAYIEHPILRLIMFLLALAWSFFVALGVYNVFIRKQPVQG